METTIKTMKQAIHTHKGSELKIIESPIPEPTKYQVRIKVKACGVCAGDAVCKYAGMGEDKQTFPRAPGHEIVGTIDKLGSSVEKKGQLKIGQMVGVGWFGGIENECGVCVECKEDRFTHCPKAKTCGVSYDGGYSEYVVVPYDAIAIVPESMDPIEAAPLMCAGLTVYNSLRNQHIKAGSLVGVVGLGGLGHLGIMFAKKLGFEVIAMSRGTDKEQLAKDLGAQHYIDMSKEDWVKQTKAIGSVKCILLTAPNASLVQPLIESLGSSGKLLILAAFHEPFNANSLSLIMGDKSIVGWASGDSRQAQETLLFAKNNDIKTMINKYTLENANEAQSNMSTARFRNVIVFN